MIIIHSKRSLIFLKKWLSPSNDISGLRKMTAADQQDFCKKSSKQTVDIAKRAITQFGLNEVTYILKAGNRETF